MSGTRHISGVPDPVSETEAGESIPVPDTSSHKPEENETWYESGTGNRDVRIGTPVFCTEVLGVVFLTSVIYGPEDEDSIPTRLLLNRHKRGYDHLPLRVFTVRETKTYLSTRDISVTNFTVFPITCERYRLWERIQQVNFENTDMFALWQYLLPDPDAGMAVLKSLVF